MFENPTPVWLAALPYVGEDSYRIYTLAGHDWNSGYSHTKLFTTAPQQHPTEPKRLLAIHDDAASGLLRWESSLVMDEGKWYVDAHGFAATPEEAAAAALAHRHTVRHIGFTDWICGGGTGRLRYETRANGQVLIVEQMESGAWRWECPIDLRRFDSIGLLFIGSSMNGSAETADDAMAAALEAPSVFRAACRAHLADTAPRPAAQIIEFDLEAA